MEASETKRSTDEVLRAVEPGRCIHCSASADPLAMPRKLVVALGTSVLIAGRLVVITDWLPHAKAPSR